MADLHEVQRGFRPDARSATALAAAIATNFPGVRLESVGLEAFVDAATCEPSPFDVWPTCPLARTLLGRADDILEVRAQSRAEQHAIEAELTPPPFAPTYDWQPTPTPCCFTGLDYDMTRGLCRIPDPMQAVLRGPALAGRTVRVLFSFTNYPQRPLLFFKRRALPRFFFQSERARHKTPVCVSLPTQRSRRRGARRWRK